MPTQRASCDALNCSTAKATQVRLLEVVDTGKLHMPTGYRIVDKTGVIPQ